MNTHISTDQLAELLEDPDSSELREVRRHLDRCPACQALYRSVIDSLQDLDPATPIPESYLAGTVDSIRSGGSTEVGATSGSGGSAGKEHSPATGGSPPPRRFPARVSVAVAAAAAVFVFVLVNRDSTPLPQAPEALQAALSRSSSSGLVLPGGLAVAPEEPVYRSGSADTSLMAVLAQMESNFDHSDSPRLDDGTWLVSGYLAADRLDQARSWLELLSEEHGEHAQLHVLAGILAYRENNLERAEEYFRLVEGSQPWGELARMDLALVLIENDKLDRAHQILQDLSRKAESPDIRSRARRELDRLD